MPDMLVKLYDLADPAPLLAELEAGGVEIRRAIPPEKHIVLKWVGDNFNDHWVSECDISFTREPVACFVAVEGGKVIGFACVDTSCRDFFGPTGVAESERGRGIGKGLLLASLRAMRELGYGYAIIGGAGPTEFYRKAAGAVPIEDSSPGVYRGMLKE